MRLSLGADAAPDLPIDAMWAACLARGLDGIELDAPSPAHERAVLTDIHAAGARITALRVERLDDAASPRIARLAHGLGAPVVVPAHAVPPSALDALAKGYDSAGVRLLLGHDSNVDAVKALASSIEQTAAPHALGLVWDVRPLVDSLADAAALLLAGHPHLGLVHLHGGGPEQASQDGRGVGSVVVDLALSGYDIDVVLRPTSEGTLPRWKRWLSSRGGSGCGSRAGAAEAKTTMELDVRGVEPKDRLDTILGAYHALAPGATIHLIVDHDPKCMYYTLEATEPKGSFSFHLREHGPEVWRAEVTKTTPAA